MKHTMTCLAAVLLLMISLATARSLLNKQSAMEKKLMVTRREAKSEGSGQTDAMIYNFTELQADLANLSMPSYLKDLYINLTYFGIDYPNDEKINTIRTYKNQPKYKKCGHVKFNMDNDTVGGEEIIKAELHLFQNNVTELPSHYNIDIFHLLSENDTQSPLQHTFKHIDSTPGWKILDITSLTLLWKNGWLNYGLQVQLTKGGETLPCEGVFANEGDSQDVQPLLIVFTHDRDSKYLNKILKNTTPMDDHNSTQQQKRNTINVQNVACHLKEMIVTADSINSTDIIVLLPERFDAGICQGHCTKLQPAPNNDHAYILSLYYRNNVDLPEVPSKCCVPASYKNISMIFYNEASVEHIMKKEVAVQATKCICL